LRTSDYFPWHFPSRTIIARTNEKAAVSSATEVSPIIVQQSYTKAKANTRCFAIEIENVKLKHKKDV